MSQTKPNKWEFLPVDQEFMESVVQFLPKKVYDMHAHLYRREDLRATTKGVWNDGPETVGFEQWRNHTKLFFKEASQLGGLFFPAPLPNVDVYAANQFLSQELSQSSLSRGLMLVTPKTTAVEIDSFFRNPQIVGFKPYHVFSEEKPTPQSSINGFCPERFWQHAHDRKAVIMLHIMRDASALDPRNIEEIKTYCRKYAQVKLILAHCARSFHAAHAEGIRYLKGLENIWFDMSGICEAEAIYSVLKYFGPEKLLWGSDFPVSQIRGRAVSLGTGFIWLDNDAYVQENALGKPFLVGVESISALMNAARWFGLNCSDREDIFWKNGLELLGLSTPKVADGQEQYLHAKKRIPGGTHLLSKRPENMAPGLWPPYFKRAQGSEVWDTDGKHYYDMSTNAVGSCLLGYGHPAVNAAVTRRVHLGSMSTLNPPEEVTLADELCRIHPWAERVRFARGGGEACAIAVRIARATTDRSLVAVCGYHGWHDWYLAANLGESDALRGHLLAGLEPLGIPRELRGTALTFRYHDREGFQQLIDMYEDRLAAVIMEPCRHEHPQSGFLEHIRKVTREKGIVLIFDEITVGWRLHFGGAHLIYKVDPDMAVFAKALGNGYPIAAVIGTTAAMEGAHSTFISSTYWTESIGPVAALATLEQMRQTDVAGHVAAMGNQVQDSWKIAAEKTGIRIQVTGFPCLAGFAFMQEDPELLRTIYTQKMLDRGFLAGTAFYPTLAHDDHVIEKYRIAIEEVFREIGQGISRGNYRQLLRGPVAKSGFSRLI